MKHFLALLIFVLALVAWSPNTKPYSVEKTEINEALAAKLGITIDDEVSYLQMTKKGLVRVKIDKKRINLTNANPEDEHPGIQPLFVTSEYENFKTGYYHFHMGYHWYQQNPLSSYFPRAIENLECFYLDYEGRHIEFWYDSVHVVRLNDSEASYFSGRSMALLMTPNPANTHFNLDMKASKDQKITIEFYDSNGNLVNQIIDVDLSLGKNSINCDVSSLQVGVYSIVCLNDERIIGKDKLIVMR